MLSREVEQIRSELVIAWPTSKPRLDFGDEDIAFVRKDELLAFWRPRTSNFGRLVESGKDGRI